MAFETAELAKINLKLEQIGATEGLLKESEPQLEGIKAVIANQTAKLDQVATALANSSQNRAANSKVAIHWLTTNAIVEKPTSANCTLSEPELDSATAVYNLATEFASGFSVNEDELKNSIYSQEEVVARGLLAASQVLDQGWAKRTIAKLDAFAGNNLYLGGNTQVGNNTIVPAANYGAGLLAYIAKAAIYNRLGSYYIIDGGELFEPAFMAAINAGNADGSGLAKLFSQYQIVTDIPNFAAAGVTSDSLLVNRSAVAFVTKNRFENTVPKQVVDQYRYKIKSQNLAGVFYDVYYQETCEVNGVTGKDEIRQTFHLETLGDLLKAPEAGYAGVIAFEKGA